jgi:hypothetical protein
MISTRALVKLRMLPFLCALSMLLSPSPLAAQARKTLPYPPGQSRIPGQPRPGQQPFPGVAQPQPAVPAYMKVRVEENQVTANIRATSAGFAGDC